MNRDFGAIIKTDPTRLRILEILQARMGYLSLLLTIRVSDFPRREFSIVQIQCRKAVDYVLRPPNPGIIEGGPLIEFHEQHALLSNPGLQSVPGGDGDLFNPPLRLTLLRLDESYVIAEGFELVEPAKPATS